MIFLSEGREVPLSLSKLSVKPGKDDARLVKLQFALKLSPETVKLLPDWLRRAYETAHDAACGAVVIGFARVIESQNIALYSIPTQGGRAKPDFSLDAVNLEEFEIDRGEDAFWLNFTVSSPLTKPLWEFLFHAAYRDVWAEISECQAELEAGTRSGKKKLKAKAAKLGKA